MKSRTGSKKVLVIGAGMAGLSAARALNHAGHEVVIFEARDRIGGRIHTRDGFDFGAHWIHGTEGNPLADLAREANLPMQFTGGDSTYTGTWERIQLRSQRGATRPDDQKVQSIISGDQWRDELEKWRENRERTNQGDMSVEAAVKEIAARRKPQKGPTPDALWHLLAWARDDSNADLSELSALNWDSRAEVFGYGDSVLLKGYAGMIEHLASALHVRTGVEVVGVETKSDGVWATPKEGGPVKEPVRFDHVVVTVPLSILKRNTITFSPSLPERKIEAIQAIGFGCLAKAGFRFHRVWWPETQYVFGRQLPTAGALDEPAVLVNAHATHGSRMLVLLIGGAAGRRFEAMSPVEAKAWAWERVRSTLAPHARAARVAEPSEHDFYRTQWSQDPFALGAYSFMKVGATSQHVEALAEAYGPVHFAGEATCVEFLANAHGAYISGLRAAREIDPGIPDASHRLFTENRRFREMRHRAQRFFDIARKKGKSHSEEKIVDWLGKHEAFKDLGTEDRQVLARMFGPRQVLEPGQSLCQQDDPAHEMYLVVEGSLVAKVSPTTAGQTTYPVRTIKPGEIAGDFAVFLHDKRRTGQLQAGEKGVVFHRLPYTSLERLLSAFPECTLGLCSIAVRETRSAMAQIVKTISSLHPDPAPQSATSLSTPPLSKTRNTAKRASRKQS